MDAEIERSLAMRKKAALEIHNLRGRAISTSGVWHQVQLTEEDVKKIEKVSRLDVNSTFTP
jgi:hypothetical protein